MTQTFEISGAAILGAASCNSIAGACPAALEVKQFATNAIHVPERTINSPVTWIDMMTANGFTKVTGLVVRIISGSLEVRQTSALAADQVIPVSDLIVFASKTVGTELTALSLRGVGTFEIMIAGS